jgi:hypothetical protein
LQEEREKAALLCRVELEGVPRFRFAWEQEGCPRCGDPLYVRATRHRTVHSLRYGTFHAVEREGYCRRHRKLPPARCEQLARLVAPGTGHAYDVLVRVGLARFLECRPDEQIRDEIRRKHGVSLGRSTVSYLARKFVAYVQAVHQESILALRGAMAARGGYILHIDGTCEEASRVLLVCMDSLSMQVLESRRINAESHDQVRDVLRVVRRDWGLPLAIVHDLRRALITAAGEVFRGVRQFVCHYHLAADVGKDILAPHVDRLRRVLRRTKVRPKLRQLVRSLKGFASAEGSGDHVVSVLLSLRSAAALRQRCTAESAKGAVHALACWVLAFAQEGEGYGFPFDLPYVSFYERIVQVHQMLNAAGSLDGKTRGGSLRELKRLRQILAAVVCGEESAELREIVADTKRDQRIFDRFRKALRVCPKGEKKNAEDAPRILSARRHRRVLQSLCASVTRQARAGGASARACKIVKQHLEKYWEYLFGHVVHKRSRTIVVPRTNNDEEGMFRILKRQCRRLHGRKDLSHDLEAMSPAVPLMRNLTNRDYCEIVYGGSEPERIADRFSRVDPKAIAELLSSWRQETMRNRIPRKLEKLANFPQRLARFISMVINELHE